ncbi:polysaccharide deacetylase family protein [uncultured Mitsuokella sp.]|uniref:polysaccharide deacetylase family protein n=1 Tax=uncultured Mitsuokella sp. TaxID=453120 RepID=UPI00344E17A6
MTKHYYNCLLLALGIGVGYFYTLGWGYYLTLGLLFVGLLSWGVFDIRLGYFIPTLYHLKDSQKRQGVLTFDDGPTELTPLFLDLLKQYEAKAIFFCIGRQIAQYPQIVQRIKEEGHLIGNHTYSHIPQNCFASTAAMTQEIQQTDALLAQLGIVTPYFRPPYGVTNPHIAKAAKRMGKIVVGWDIRSRHCRRSPIRIPLGLAAQKALPFSTVWSDCHGFCMWHSIEENGRAFCRG